MTSPAEPVAGPPAPGRRAAVLRWAALAAMAVAVVAAVAVIGVAVGTDGLLLASLLALVPLVVVVRVLLWVDRWEPEPRWAMALALFWGAGVGALVALVVNTGAQVYLTFEGLGTAGAASVTSVVVAPVVEEGIKGLGVLLLAVAARRYLDSVIDGVVYAGLVAAGFAFTENILYFAQALDGTATGEAGVAVVFFVRAVMSPFAHVLFTVCIGAAIGRAARRPGTMRLVVAYLLAWPVAALLHGLWNASGQSLGGFVSVYVLVQVPLFLAACWLVLWLRRTERSVIRRNLEHYRTAGLLTGTEVAIASDPAARRQAAAWASSLGPAAKAALRQLTTSAVALAFEREKASHGRAELGASVGEAELLRRVTVARGVLVDAEAVRWPHGRPAPPAAQAGGRIRG